jgi:vanillate O-demethylase monooxygenase subunit
MYLKNAWYIAAWGHEVGTAPFARTLLDEPVVLYRDGDGRAAALADRCCHRGLPLSLGRVVDGALECGYHGLTFAADGRCIRVPGQRQIPPDAAVRSYPVVERHRWIWLWPGDPALADPGLVPDCFWNDRPGWRMYGEHHRVACHYQALIDIQLDNTHAPYVHPATIGSSALTSTPPRIERAPRSLSATRWMMNVEPPPTFAKAGGFTGNVDRWLLWTYLPPALGIFDIGVAEAGSGAERGDRSKGITMRTAHFATPETATTCHYFWSFARNYRLDDAAISERLDADMSRTFGEDVTMVEAQQRSLARSGDGGRIDVAADSPTLQARALLARLIEEEAAGAGRRAVA